MYIYKEIFVKTKILDKLLRKIVYILNKIKYNK